MSWLLLVEFDSVCRFFQVPVRIQESPNSSLVQVGLLCPVSEEQADTLAVVGTTNAFRYGGGHVNGNQFRTFCLVLLLWNGICNLRTGKYSKQIYRSMISTHHKLLYGKLFDSTHFGFREQTYGTSCNHQGLGHMYKPGRAYHER